MKYESIVDFIRPGSNLNVLSSLFGLKPKVTGLNFSINKSYKVWLDNFNDLNEWYFEYLISNINRNKFYVGWELSPGICKALVNIGVNFISIGISPIRCFSDYDVYYVSNLSLEDGLTWDDYIDSKIYEFKVKKIADKISYQEVEDKDVYILGQLPLDAASIYEGRFCGLSDVFEVYKPENYKIVSHPFSRLQGPSMIKLAGLSYSLLKYEDRSRLLTFSSSLQYESLLFENCNKVEAVHDYYALYKGISNFGFLNSQNLSKLLDIKLINGSIKDTLKIGW